MEGAAQTFLSNAVQLLSNEYQLLRGVGGGVAELRDDLDVLNALLVMQSEAEDGAVDRFVQVCMKQLRELAYDAEDCIELYRLRIKSRPDAGVRAWLTHLLSTAKLFARRRLACEISALRARAVAISERQVRYGVNRDALRLSPSMLTATASASANMLSHHGNDPDRHQVVGIQDQVDALVGRLNKGEKDDLKVFSVVGFGGLGKTTLAMEVCRQLGAEFRCLAMVSVSQAFDPARDLNPLLNRVVKQILTAKSETGEEQNLGMLLKDKRYLIVIDDVWTIQAWEAIQSMLPMNRCGSRIIVTTRIDAVAKACSSASVNEYYIHRMKPLEHEDSKKLFLSRAFGSAKAAYPGELKDAMDGILKKCGGLPLAVVSIASVLAGYRTSGSKEKWETVCNSIGSHMEGNPTLEGMKHIITLSYNHLPHELKGCMMYLSLFPEDYDIDKPRLLSRWIAEGLVPEKRGLTPMQVAESYLEELVSRNMIELRHDFSYYWKEEWCRVHDMLLEVMVSRSLECNFVSLLLEGQSAAGRIRRLSVQGDGDRRPQNTEQQQHNKKKAGNGLQGMDVEHVRSLSIFQHGGKRLLDHLGKFTLLRVLDLEDCQCLTSHHVRSICKLYLLKFLSFKGTNISQVPPQVEKLEHLQTLDVRETTVQGLPETVTRLHKLERLQISYSKSADRMWRLPLGLNKMKALREVGFSVLGNHLEVARDVGELEQLRELVVYVDDIGFDKEVLQGLAKSLSKLYSLRGLIMGDVSYGRTLDFLHEVDPPPRLLRYLIIAGGISELPRWIGSLTYLVQFNISWRKLVGDQLFQVLCNCPSLKTINIRYMGYIDDELVARAKHVFLELTSLRVTSDIPDSKVPHVVGFERGSMPKLELLMFNFTDNYNKKIVGVEHLPSLKEVQLWGHKDNPALVQALEELNAENTRRRRESNDQFRVVVKYSVESHLLLDNGQYISASDTIRR